MYVKHKDSDKTATSSDKNSLLYTHTARISIFYFSPVLELSYIAKFAFRQSVSLWNILVSIFKTMGVVQLPVSTIVVFAIAFVLASYGSVDASGDEYYQSEKCSDTTCRAAPRGSSCQPFYNSRDDGCCPEWQCQNGQTVYGIYMFFLKNKVLEKNYGIRISWTW